MSDTKVYEMATCPYCGHEDFYSFHYGADTLFCHNCNKEFAIKLATVIKVTSAKIYDKKCSFCHVPLYDEETVNGKCPNCGCEVFDDNKYNDSEFDVDRSYWDYF